MGDEAISNKKRENGLDLLRIISAVAVVLIHVNAFYFVDHVKNNDSQNSLIYIVESILNIVTRFSVPCFVMISGAFNLNNDKNSDWRSFYCKSFYKTFLPVIFVAVLLMIFDIACHLLIGGTSLIKIFVGIAVGNFYNLWFMYMLLGLYLITPFVIKLKQNISNNEFKMISIVLCIWACISQATSSQKTAYSIGIVFAYLGYYMLGSVLMTEKSKGKILKSYIYIILIITLILTFVVRRMGITYYVSNAYTNFFSPTIMVASICVFKLFLHLEIQRDCSKIASHTFFVYLFHTVIYTSIYAVLNRFCSEWISINEIIRIIVVFFLTIVLSYIASVIYDRILLLLSNIGMKDKWYNMKIWKKENINGTDKS